jgi:trk system potassium uptake protein TrkH
MAITILGIYFIFTIACMLCLHFAGMSVFDALCHAMSAVATGGFANYDSSIGHFNSPLIDTICMVFMLLGAMPFVLYIRLGKGDSGALFRDSQVRAYLSIVCFLSIACAIYLVWTGQQPLLAALRNGFFTTITLMTTTGFASGDYTLWGPFIIGIAFLATFLGSCSGSTSGGIKIFRLQILWLMLQQQARKLVIPHGIFQVQYNGKVVEPSVQAAVAGFFFLYMASWLVFSILLQMTGLDFITAFTGAITALSNVGPGLGGIIGPAGNFSMLEPSAVWILSAAMLLGRVEFFTLLVLLMPRFWKT